MKPVAWLYFHSRMEEPLCVQLEEPECVTSFPTDVTWKKPLYTADQLKQLVELVRLQHEALGSCSMGCSYDVQEVVAALEAFNKWEGK